MLSLHVPASASNPSSCPAAKLRELYEAFADLDYGEIVSTVYSLLAPLSRADVLKAARHFGIHQRLGSKRAAVAAVAAVIRDRKDSWSRCQFRTIDEV